MNQNYMLPPRTAFVLLCSLLLALTSNAQSPTFTAVISSGLSTPVDIVNAGDNTNRLFIISQKSATIRVYSSTFNFLGTLMTVPDVGTFGFEEGLLSIAFHPDYETNRYFFVYYTNTAGNLELARFQTTMDPLVADPLSKTIILTIPHPGQSNHNGAKLNFGSDGNLYFATGDGGGGNDPGNNAQTGTTLLGKMLRINVNPGQATPYTIPADNPYVSDATVLDEIWALGLRNPFRWSFDRLTGDMWIGDVGQSAWEEINFRAGPATATGGVNYQWVCYEGTHSLSGCSVTSGPGIDVPPIFEYPNPGNAAVTGGIVYRGSQYADLMGTYFAADFYSGTLYLIRNVSGSWVTTPLTGYPDWIAAFGESENGELFALSLRGTLYSVTGALVTPVSLTSFTWTKNSSGFELAWETKNELNVDRYEIEESSNGTNFRTLGQVKANNGSNYKFHHPTDDKKLFYRLRVVDIDGKFEYSKIIQASKSELTTVGFVRPSVIRNNVLDILVTESYEHIQVINMQGREVWRQKLGGRTGALSYSLPALPAGNYVVRMIGSNKVAAQKILLR